MSRNGERAEKARGALAALHAGDDEDAIVDLIADLLHHARERHLDPERVAERALNTWLSEDRDPRGDGRRYLGLLARLRARAVWYAAVAVAAALIIDKIGERVLATVH